MTENGGNTSMKDDQPDSTVTEESLLNTVSVNQHPTFERIRGKLDEVLKELKTVETQFGEQLEKLEFLEELKTVKTQFRDQRIVLEKLQSIENQLEELKPQKILTEGPTPEVTEEKKSADDKQKTPDPLVSKQFVLKHIFKNMSGAEENKPFDSESEEHFGVKWFIGIRRKNENLACYLHCEWPETEKEWSIETDFEIKAYGPNNNIQSAKENYCFPKRQGYGFPSFIKWENLEKDYLIDDSLKIEIHVKINSTTGIYKDNLRTFDESMQDVSDITLSVNEEKFHVSKLYLATHSAYFRAMFLGMFGDSRKSEISLTGIDAADFQNYLEVIYAESAIDETTVEGILLVADMYDTPLAIRKCEEFLIEKSTKSLKKKLLMAMRYHLESLKKKCLDEIKTIDILRSVTSVDIDDLDLPMTALLLKKSLSFQ